RHGRRPHRRRRLAPIAHCRWRALCAARGAAIHRSPRTALTGSGGMAPAAAMLQYGAPELIHCRDAMPSAAARPFLVPLIVACALFMENLDSTVIATALPAIAHSLDEDPLRLNLAITCYLLSLAVFIPL